MSMFPLVPLTEMADIHDYLREPISQTARNKREGTYPYFGATGQVGWIDGYRQDGKYVLLGEDGAPFLDPHKTKAYIVEGKCWVNNHAHVLKGKEGVCDDDFLCFVLNWADYSEAVTGSTRLKLPQNTMNRLLIPRPRIEEQRQIAARLKAQLAEVETARQAAQEQAHGINLALNQIIEAQIARAISSNNNPVKLGEVSTITAKLVQPERDNYGALPHVSAENIETLTGRLMNIRSAKDDGMTSGKYLFDAGDILYSKLRPYLRKVARPDFAGLCSADMYPIKADTSVLDMDFLKLLLSSNLFTEYANEKSARSRMPKLNREQLFDFGLSLPLLEVQEECVELVGSVLALSEQASIAAKCILKDIELLPKRILAQAFAQ